LLLNRPLASLDSGDVAYQTLGWAGAVAVIAAGWTTSNPTLYRAGLALQAVTPNWSRARITLIAGVITTIIACSPFVFTGLLNFVGIYGLLLAPAGAIVLTEHWIFPRIGFTRYWTAARGALLNWPALISWGVGIAVALGLERTGTLHLFYLFLPVYVLTAVLYTVLAAFAGARDPHRGALEHEPVTHAAPPRHTVAAGASNPALKWASGLLALAALVVSIAVPVSVALAGMDGFAARHASMKTWLILATVVYFIFGTTFYQLWRKEKEPGQ
jgi:cytosine permease